MDIKNNLILTLKYFLKKLSCVLFLVLFNPFIILADPSKYGGPSDFKTGSNDSYLKGVLIVLILIIIVAIIGVVKNKNNK